MISVLKESYAIRCILTSTQTTWCKESLHVLATPTLLCNRSNGTRMRCWNTLLIQPADYQHPSHTSNVRFEFLPVSRSTSKTPGSGRRKPFGPVKQEARCCLKSLVPCSVLISGQIIEIAIENPHHKGRKGNLLLDICLQEIIVWMKCTMWVNFISQSSGKCFAIDRGFLHFYFFFFERTNLVFFFGCVFFMACKSYVKVMLCYLHILCKHLNSLHKIASATHDLHIFYNFQPLFIVFYYYFFFIVSFMSLI